MILLSSPSFTEPRKQSYKPPGTKMIGPSRHTATKSLPTGHLRLFKKASPKTFSHHTSKQRDKIQTGFPFKLSFNDQNHLYSLSSPEEVHDLLNHLYLLPLDFTGTSGSQCFIRLTPSWEKKNCSSAHPSGRQAASEQTVLITED